MEYKKLDDINVEIIDGDRGKNYPNGNDFKKEKYCLFLNAKNVTEQGFNFSEVTFINKEKDNILRKGKLEKEDIVMTTRGTVGNVAYYSNNISYKNIRINSGMVILRCICIENIIPKYLYYALKSKYVQEQINRIRTGSAQPQLPISILKNIKVYINNVSIQKKIVKILEAIDNKIELNNQINDNLQEQLKILFNRQFFDRINKNDINDFKQFTLYDVLDVIDNRGKTPKLVEKSEYPIIDVKAISGEGRIIDYKQCQKYVSKEVYDTFFRSGHPIINDILISTVGSLAEMKIYKENIGTIAQNVVALRSKTDYPMYIYQYLIAIKNDLISYNIGSVQPSIKVTQFMKHSIYIPNNDELYEFENLAQIYTDKMFALAKENEYLEQLKDTLLPKLMNGEIDLDKIEI